MGVAIPAGLAQIEPAEPVQWSEAQEDLACTCGFTYAMTAGTAFGATLGGMFFGAFTMGGAGGALASLVLYGAFEVYDHHLRAQAQTAEQQRAHALVRARIELASQHV